MEKKYNLPEENNDTNHVSEPAIAYKRKSALTPPCVFTDEEKRQQIEQTIDNMENGLGYSIEEVFGKYKK